MLVCATYFTLKNQGSSIPWSYFKRVRDDWTKQHHVWVIYSGWCTTIRYKVSVPRSELKRCHPAPEDSPSLEDLSCCFLLMRTERELDWKRRSPYQYCPSYLISQRLTASLPPMLLLWDLLCLRSGQNALTLVLIVGLTPQSLDKSSSKWPLTPVNGHWLDISSRLGSSSVLSPELGLALGHWC